MLFDQEANKLQEGFNCLNWLQFKGVESGIARFETAFGTLEVSAPGANVLRLRCLRAPAPDYDILTGLEAPDPSLTVENGEKIRVKTGNLELLLEQEPLRLTVYRAGKLMLESSTDLTIGGVLRLHPLAADEERWLLSLALPSEEPVYGLGEKFGSLNKRGQKSESRCRVWF